MKGDPTLWLPGGDHAGIETQYVFEKHLAKEGKSRFDFDRQTLYQMIWDFCDKNKNLNRDQMKRAGFSLDWSRYHYSLEPQIVEMVYETFRRLFKDGLIYRGERIVNFCTKCGTAFSELEIEYVERKDSLYYLKYGPFILATTRPETKFGDTAVAFHPGDKRYEKYLGKTLEIQGVNGPFSVLVVADKEIDPNFGTGIEKVTPAHDSLDFDIAQRHNLPIKTVIDRSGRLTDLAGKFAGLKVAAARQAVVEEMQRLGLIDHIDENYVHNVATCYRCHSIIEPMVIPQWFVKIDSLKKPAIEAIKEGRTKIFPKKRFEKLYFDWMENLRDWNISRSIVWGPQIPIWYCLDCNKGKITVNKIDSGIQNVLVEKEASYQLENDLCIKCGGSNLVQETDTFDTWFLSGQWPVNTLRCHEGDLDYFYSTSVLDTLWDILFFWVGRMMMLGIYLTGDVPFETVHLHARVVDKEGKKMSKSKGNVMDPIPMIDLYGADALRMALVIGVASAGDIAISEDKIKAMRNFSNKVWNIGRFILDAESQVENGKLDEELNLKIKEMVKSTTKNIEGYKFGVASENLYQFIWHEFADKYLEEFKQGNVSSAVLKNSFEILLKLLHPFMPFVTEEIWGKVFLGNHSQLIIAPWPKY
jgi:valyl-tRNA synthetase